MAAKRQWTKVRRAVPPDGVMRPSQLLTTFGPGAMLDLLEDAVLVGGLDFWRFGNGFDTIEEPRLREDLARRLAAANRRLALSGAFRLPPTSESSDATLARGIAVQEFPRWFVCQNEKCRALVRSADGLTLTAGRYLHDCDGAKKPSPCVPVRFVAGCVNGHLDDFPWKHFVHDGKPCAAPSMRLLEGATGDFGEVRVTCACGASRPILDASVPEKNPPCSGARPWLGPDGRQPDGCSERIRLLIRSASNAYFAQVESALTLPESADPAREAVRSVWDVLAAGSAETLPAFRQIPKVGAAIANLSDAEVLAAIAAEKGGSAAKREPLRVSEFRTISSAQAELSGELPDPDDVFFARAAQPAAAMPASVARLVLLPKLREVRVQVGFTRIEPVSADLQGEYDLAVRSCPLGTDAVDWLPASEIRGEGFFLQLDEDAVRKWEESPAVIERAKQLERGFAQWARRLESPQRFPGARYYLLHSLAHGLISALSLECGYAASAIRERIYCAPANDPVPMAALMLSTGTSGADGTLGGLVEQGRNIGAHLRRAWEMARLCSNDPVCSAHDPAGLEERHLEGAACHGCLFVAECSCERNNTLLDRALLVPTLGNSAAAFFKDPP